MSSHSPSCQILAQTLSEEGFAVCEKVLEKSLVQKIISCLQESIQSYAEELGYSPEEYLSAISRWVDPSLVTGSIPQEAIDKVSEIAALLAKEPVAIKKKNVICKNAYAQGKVPFHQDISYSPSAPYQFTAWIALNEVTESNGALEVVPQSHLQGIEPAVDFWSPEYKPSPSLHKKARKLPVHAGDVIFFDSRLWHGSSENQDQSSRYALVLRLTALNWKPFAPIPPFKPLFFGMWTCGEMTQKLLSQGIEFFTQDKEPDFSSLLDKWSLLLKASPPSFIPSHKIFPALKALQKVQLLHLASNKHNGGDATGLIYQDLWHFLLQDLQAFLQNATP